MKTNPTNPLITTLVSLAGLATLSQAAVTYTQDFSAGAVADNAAELPGSGTPVDIDGAGTAYTTVYEAGDFFAGAGVTTEASLGAPTTADGWLNGWTRSTSGNTMVFFDLGSALDTVDGSTIDVGFTIGRHSGRAIDDGTYLVQLFDGLSDVTDSGNFFTANDTPLGSQTVTIASSAFYDEFYNGVDNTQGVIKNVSLSFAGLSNTTDNLFLAITIQSNENSNKLGMLDNISVSQSIPEPSAALLGGIGLLGLLRRRRG